MPGPAAARGGAAGDVAPRAVATEPPATQLASSLPALPTAPGRRLVVRLSPRELGHVEIRLAGPPGGATLVSLTAERPETLRLLVRDQAALHHALAAAGLTQATTTLHFALAASPAAADLAPPTGPGPASTGDAGGNAGNPGGRQADGGGASPPSADDPVPGAEPGPGAPPTRSGRRAGIDITA